MTRLKCVTHCQRLGKNHIQPRAPLVRVPVITEPFRRQITDIVGPLKRTKAGYKYILTMLCPASKYPEAIPLKVANSQSMKIEELLKVFARVRLSLTI